MNDDTLLILKEYGKVNIKLKELLDSRNMKRDTLARAINTHFSVIDKWYKNKVTRIDADILARMCFVLKCEVSDIIEFIK